MENREAETTIIDRIVEWYPGEQFVKFDGFDAAILGVHESSMRLIYSTTRIIEILTEQGVEDPEEHFEYNMEGAYMGEKTPLFCADWIAERME